MRPTVAGCANRNREWNTLTHLSAPRKDTHVRTHTQIVHEPAFLWEWPHDNAVLASGSLLQARLQSTDVLDILGFYSCSCVAGTVGAVKEGECQVDCGLKLTIDGGHAWVGKCYSSCLDAQRGGAQDRGFAYKLPGCWTWCEAIPALLLASASDEEDGLSQALGEGTHHVSVTLSNRHGQVLAWRPGVGSCVPPFSLCDPRNKSACMRLDWSTHHMRERLCVSLCASTRIRMYIQTSAPWFLVAVSHCPSLSRSLTPLEQDLSARHIVSFLVAPGQDAPASSPRAHILGPWAGAARVDPRRDSSSPADDVHEEGGGVQAAGAALEAALARYAEIHARSRRCSRWCGVEDGIEAWETGECLRALVWTCPVGQDGSPLSSCGGLADRLKGILSLMIMALLSSRSLFIDFRTPVFLEDYAAPHRIDWRVHDVPLLLRHDESAANARGREQAEVDENEGRRMWWGQAGGLLHGGLAHVDRIMLDATLANWDADLAKVFDFQTWFQEPSSGHHPALMFMCNQALFHKLVRSARAFVPAQRVGLLAAFPSPHPHLMRFLFQLHPAMALFARDTLQSAFPPPLAARLLGSPLFRHFLNSSAPGDGGLGGMERVEEERGRTRGGGHLLVSVQLRYGGHFGYSQDWKDPVFLEPVDIRAATVCLEGLLQRIVPEEHASGDVQVFVVADHPKPRADFARMAETKMGTRISGVASLAPEALHHVDRELDIKKAAAGFKWALLEMLMVAASDAALVSSGYGEVAANIGGMTPQKTLHIKAKRFVVVGKSQRDGDKHLRLETTVAKHVRCVPVDMAQWFHWL